MNDQDQTPRRPRVFALDDPKLTVTPEPEPAPSPLPDDADDGAPRQGPRRSQSHPALPTMAGVSRGIRFGALFMSATLALATLAASISFFRFVSVALERDDWLGWLAVGLLGIATLSGLVLVARELLGLWALARLGRMRADMNQAIANRDPAAERAGLTRLKSLYAGRPDLAWGLARLAEHERDIHDPGRLLALADRELMAPLDTEARRMVLRSAKRVSKVTALSPWAFLAIGYVLVENVGLMRRLATLYGGRPGVLGSLRLARLVVIHIIGTGSVALTDDLLGQFFGQDVLRRLSRRLGEGVFNALLTVRLGAAALDVIRPLPFIETDPVRARDIVKELWAGEG